MKKLFLFMISFLFICGSAFAEFCYPQEWHIVNYDLVPDSTTVQLKLQSHDGMGNYSFEKVLTETDLGRVYKRNLDGSFTYLNEVSGILDLFDYANLDLYFEFDSFDHCGSGTWKSNIGTMSFLEILSSDKCHHDIGVNVFGFHQNLNMIGITQYGNIVNSSFTYKDIKKLNIDSPSGEFQITFTLPYGDVTISYYHPILYMQLDWGSFIWGEIWASGQGMLDLDSFPNGQLYQLVNGEYVYIADIFESYFDQGYQWYLEPGNAYRLVATIDNSKVNMDFNYGDSFYIESKMPGSYCSGSGIGGSGSDRKGSELRQKMINHKVAGAYERQVNP